VTVANLVIPRRFNGPPRSGNGGYVCGRLAGYVAGPARVRLRAPPPLERELTVEATGDEARLLDGEVLVAEARRCELGLTVPATPGFAQAQAASKRYPGFLHHHLPGCFVCGPQRAEGDGLRIFPGPVAGRGIAAAPWTPHASLGDGGTVRAEHLWAALDCPSYFGMQAVSPARVTALLGRLAAHIHRLPRVGEPCIAAGWLLGRDGRKIHAATAIFSGDGELLGASRATWIDTQR
jgi:hypothetical protein